MREGSLEAPTRHPLDWQEPRVPRPGEGREGARAVFDICHGCRRCVSLCTAFPTLFDLVDASPTMEVDGVRKEDYAKVVDQCYLCDLCYMTKCPYVPPHPWNVDFPHVMLRAKALKFEKGIRFRDRLLSSTDALGKLAAIPGGRADRECPQQELGPPERCCRASWACTRTGSCRPTRLASSDLPSRRVLPFPCGTGRKPPARWRSSPPAT